MLYGMILYHRNHFLYASVSPIHLSNVLHLNVLYGTSQICANFYLWLLSRIGSLEKLRAADFPYKLLVSINDHNTVGFCYEKSDLRFCFPLNLFFYDMAFLRCSAFWAGPRLCMDGQLSRSS